MNKNVERKEKIKEITTKGESKAFRDEYKKHMGYEDYIFLDDSIYTLWLEQKIVEMQDINLSVVKGRKDFREMYKELRSKHKKLKVAFINHAPADITKEYFNIKSKKDEN